MIKDILYSIRPSACILTSLLVLGAYRPAVGEYTEAIIASVCAFCGAAYCFLVNDIFDRKKDLANRKSRPIATGKLPITHAWLAATAFISLFLVCAYSLGTAPFILSFVFLGMATLYSYVNNASGFVANVLVGFIASGTQWGVYIIRPDAYLIYSSFLFFFVIVSREILLDWLDASGDKAVGKSSVPIRFTSRQTLSFILIFYLLGSLTLLLAQLYYSLSSTATWFQYVALVALWLPAISLISKKNRKAVLLNIRSSHIAFAFIFLALLTR